MILICSESIFALVFKRILGTEGPVQKELLVQGSEASSEGLADKEEAQPWLGE